MQLCEEHQIMQNVEYWYEENADYRGSRELFNW